MWPGRRAMVETKTALLSKSRTRQTTMQPAIIKLNCSWGEDSVKPELEWMSGDRTHLSRNSISNDKTLIMCRSMSHILGWVLKRFARDRDLRLGTIAIRKWKVFWSRQLGRSRRQWIQVWPPIPPIPILVLFTLIRLLNKTTQNRFHLFLLYSSLLAM
jgi:hypothetical protein